MYPVKPYVDANADTRPSDVMYPMRNYHDRNTTPPTNEIRENGNESNVPKTKQDKAKVVEKSQKELLDEIAAMISYMKMIQADSMRRLKELDEEERKMQQKVTGEAKQQEVTGEVKQQNVTGEAKQQELTGEVKQQNVTGEAKQQEVTGEVKQQKVTGEAKQQEVKQQKVTREAKQQEVAGEVKQQKVIDEAKQKEVIDEAKHRKVIDEAKQKEVIDEAKHRKVTGGAKQQEITGKVKQQEFTGDVSSQHEFTDEAEQQEFTGEVSQKPFTFRKAVLRKEKTGTECVPNMEFFQIASKCPTNITLMLNDIDKRCLKNLARIGSPRCILFEGLDKNISTEGYAPPCTTVKLVTSTRKRRSIVAKIDGKELSGRVPIWKLLGSLIHIYPTIPQHVYISAYIDLWLMLLDDVLSGRCTETRLCAEMCMALSSRDYLVPDVEGTLADVMAYSVITEKAYHANNIELWMRRINTLLNLF